MSTNANNLLFNVVGYTVGSLLDQIELGFVGLPDIQRPFVWKNAKIRDLLDSMYRGFPVGYLLLWQNANMEGVRGIGVDGKQKHPNLLIVDGQQRLTSLYAVVKGRKVLREDYSEENIEIAFHPLEEKFEVADAAIRKDKHWLPNVSRLWAADTDLFELVDEYLEGLAQTQELTTEETRQCRQSIKRLQGLLNYPFQALELLANGQRGRGQPCVCPHQQQGAAAQRGGLHPHLDVRILGRRQARPREVLARREEA